MTQVSHKSRDMTGGELSMEKLDIKHVPSLDSDDIEEVTDEDRATLRKVPDALPWSAFLVAVVELCERFAYYGVSGPFQNYLQLPKDDTKQPGAIGLGEAHATGSVQTH
jgi:POT family proton-dependent oligopeptide transporter